MPVQVNPAGSARQRAFVREFAIDHDITKATIRAGYSKKTACSIGSQLLKKPLVAAAVAKYEAKAAKKTELTIEVIAERLNVLSQEAFRDSDRIRANQLLGEYLGMFKNRFPEDGDLPEVSVPLKEGKDYSWERLPVKGSA